MRCRLLRLSQSCDVLPSVGVGAELAPSRADLDTFILRLSLQNLQVLRLTPLMITVLRLPD